MLAECFTALLQAVGASPAYHESGGKYRIRFEGNMDLSFIQHGDALAVSMPLADPPPSSDRRAFFRRALRAGLGLLPEEGTRIFLVPALSPDGGLLLQARLPAEPQAFVRAVEMFLNEAEKWGLAIGPKGTSSSRPRAFFPGKG